MINPEGVAKRPIPKKTQQHIRRIQAESQHWKRKYEAELGSIIYERNAWRSYAKHLRDCPILNNCNECGKLWAVATKTPQGNKNGG